MAKTRAASSNWGAGLDGATRTLVVAGGILVALSFISSVLKGATSFNFMGAVTTVLITVFSLAHGLKRYGLRWTIFFVAIITIVSWGYETLSILTGFPFGHYHYTDGLGPKLWLVPLVIMPAYFSVGYLSWVIGHILLGKADGGIRGAEFFLLPLLSAFVMVAWDMSMDPINSTLARIWVWQDGGGYYGVPFQNYMGWYLCVFTFYLIFAACLRRANPTTNTRYWNAPVFNILPILMYAQHMAEYVAGALFKRDVQVTSAEGHVWWASDIYTGLTLVSVFTMGFISVYALIRVSADFVYDAEDDSRGAGAVGDR